MVWAGRWRVAEATGLLEELETGACTLARELYFRGAAGQTRWCWARKEKRASG